MNIGTEFLFFFKKKKNKRNTQDTRSLSTRENSFFEYMLHNISIFDVNSMFFLFLQFLYTRKLKN